MITNVLIVGHQRMKRALFQQKLSFPSKGKLYTSSDVLNLPLTVYSFDSTRIVEINVTPDGYFKNYPILGTLIPGLDRTWCNITVTATDILCGIGTFQTTLSSVQKHLLRICSLSKALFFTIDTPICAHIYIGKKIDNAKVLPWFRAF